MPVIYCRCPVFILLPRDCLHMCYFSCLFQLTGDWSGALVLLITDRLQHWRLQQKMFFCWVLLFVCFFASLAFTEQYTSSWSLTGNRQLLSFWSKKMTVRCNGCKKNYSEKILKRFLHDPAQWKCICYCATKTGRDFFPGHYPWVTVEQLE